MSNRIAANPAMVEWAVDRSGLTISDFGRAAAWVAGEQQPTWRQLEDFAKKARVPIGYLFLSEPPLEQTPLADFRISGPGTKRDQLDLLDVIHECRRQQAWYSEYAEREGLPAVAWVGSADRSSNPSSAAAAMGLRVDMSGMRASSDAAGSLRRFRGACEDAGALVMSSGIVAGNNRRVLDPELLSGFSLSDEKAPLVFLNTRSSESRRIFTLAHELGHLVLGQGAIDELGDIFRGKRPAAERWCNVFASALLMPESLVREIELRGTPVEAARLLSRRFKVSPTAALIRLGELAIFQPSALDEAFAEVERANSPRGDTQRGGGNYYLNLRSRLGQRFSEALASSISAGEISRRDAFRLAGLRTASAYEEFAREVRAS